MRLKVETSFLPAQRPSAVQFVARTDFLSEQFDRGWKTVGGRGGRQRREDPRDRFGTWETRSRSNHDPGDQKKVNDRRSNRDLAFGLRRGTTSFPSPAYRILISPLPSVLTLPDSDERARRRRWRRFNDNAEMEERAMRDRSKSFATANQDSCLISWRQSGRRG